MEIFTDLICCFTKYTKKFEYISINSEVKSIKMLILVFPSLF